MALQQDFVRVVVIIGAIIVAMLALTAVFGMQLTGPSYDLVVDPANGLGLPF